MPELWTRSLSQGPLMAMLWEAASTGQRMSQAGKQVWDKLVPYCTRHWVAVQFLIANDYTVYATAKRLGDTVGVVERAYLPHAEARSG